MTDRVTFGLYNGTLSTASLAYDWQSEANKVYALGEGDLDEQLVGTAVDTARVNQSAIGLSEVAISGDTGLGSDELTAVAQDELSRRRPSAILTAKIANNPNPVRNKFSPQYGYHWNYGDRVRVRFRGRFFSVIVRAVNVKVDATGKETITARVEDVNV